MSLKQYHQKRHFQRTPEPKGRKNAGSKSHLFVIQKHAASRLHYDFRLQLDGVLKSWAVPKGPSVNPAVKRLAMHVEDHPVEYGSFEGIIPKGEYGGGTVMLWDQGTWTPDGDPSTGYQQGKLKFALHGRRLQGRWTLARIKARQNERGDPWLLIKEHDGQASPSREVEEEFQTSVASGRSMEEIAARREAVWSSNRSSRSTGKTHQIPAEEQTNAGLSLGALAGARRASMPAVFKPELATPVDVPPGGDAWLHELKLDGYRMLAFLRNGHPRLITRNGLDWTKKFPSLVEALSRLPVHDGLLDGEIVVLRDDGTTDFQALQRALEQRTSAPLYYYLFDLPYCEGYDLTRVPLSARKEVLKTLLERQEESNPSIRYSEHIQGHGEEFLHHACGLQVEGVVSKKVSSLYVQKRSPQWLKMKCSKRQEFVIAGYTKPRGTRTGFRSLLLGYYDRGRRLHYAGRVGTGFAEQMLQSLLKRLRALEVANMPFFHFPSDLSRPGLHWVKPQLVAEVRFTEWTSEGVLRHPSFLGLRVDKSPHEIVREAPVPLPSAAPKVRVRKPSRLSETSRSLSNPERVLYPEQGITKIMLAKYYETVAPWILPHVTKRPLTIVRCPRGYHNPCFYQKHVTEGLPPSIRGLRVKEKHGSMTTLVIDDLEGLMGLVQLGVLEIHPWGCREDALDKPDRLVFDLDPGADIALKELIEAARLVRGVLEALGLTSFLKTTGGKGLHVVVPLLPRASWEEIKQFAKTIAGMLTAHDSSRYIDVMTKSKRSGKIYIDYLRNGYGATSVAPYSTRARAGAPVSTPLHWHELNGRLGLTGWNLKTVPGRLARLKRDLWTGFFEVRQAVTPAMIRRVTTLGAKVLARQ